NIRYNIQKITFLSAFSIEVLQLPLRLSTHHPPVCQEGCPSGAAGWILRALCWGKSIRQPKSDTGGRFDRTAAARDAGRIRLPGADNTAARSPIFLPPRPASNPHRFVQAAWPSQRGENRSCCHVLFFSSKITIFIISFSF